MDLLLLQLLLLKHLLLLQLLELQLLLDLERIPELPLQLLSTAYAAGPLVVMMLMAMKMLVL